jgi:hypothetical protein
MLKSSPLKLITTIPKKPIMQAMIFFNVNFSCLKIKQAINSEKKALEPDRTVVFTPEVYTSPT